MKKPVALFAAALSVAALASPAQAGSIPKQRYDCVVFYAPGMPSPTGRAVKVVSRTKYSWFDSKRWKSGKYKHGAGSRIAFRSGPLKGMKGAHKVYGNGKHGVDVTFRTSSGASKYYCS